MRSLLVLLMLMPAPVLAQDEALVALAKRTLSSLQDRSFRKRREFCGVIGYTADGELVASPAVAGTRDSCSAAFPDTIAAIASYHTHGAFDRGYVNEVPSTFDLRSDSALYMDGFVSTPGGRLWFVDGRQLLTTQMCGLGCLPIAPDFIKGLNGKIATQYTLEELIELGWN